MTAFLQERALVWLAGATLGLASQAAWLRAHGHPEEALARLLLGPLAGALVCWLVAEALALAARRFRLEPWPLAGRLSRFLGRTVWALSGLDQRRGRRAWIKALALGCLPALFLAHQSWWLPRQGAEQVREYFLAQQEPGGKGLRTLFYDHPDGIGPARDLGLCQDWSFASLERMPGQGQRYFWLRWLGVIEAPADGWYGFGGRVDDGLVVIVDGRVVARDLLEGPPREVWGKTRLQAGWHAIEVHFLQLAGGATLELFWQPPKQNRQPLAQARLRPLKASAPLAPMERVRLEHGLMPRPWSTYDPFEGGRFWSLPW